MAAVENFAHQVGAIYVFMDRQIVFDPETYSNFKAFQVDSVLVLPSAQIDTNLRTIIAKYPDNLEQALAVKVLLSGDRMAWVYCNCS